MTARRCVAIAMTIVAAAVGQPRAANAQAWLPESHEGAVTITYQGLFSEEHLDAAGNPYDKGRVSSDMLRTGVEYALSDRFVVATNVAFVATKHEGADRLHGPLDTGVYHGTVQDARVSLAIRVPAPHVAFAPYVGAILPTHDYETRGHSAPGRHLRTLQLGAWVGRDLDRWVPRAYVQGHYGFSLVEPVGGMSINRSNVDFETGYGVSSRLTATVGGAIQRTHGGIEFPLVHDDHYADVFPFHDRVARDNYFLMSAGATYAATSTVSVFATLVRTVSGQNTHRVKGMVTGVAWSFSRGLRLGAASPQPPPLQP